MCYRTACASPVHREIKKISSAATVVDRRLECVTLAEGFGWAGHSCPFQELSASRAAGRTRTNKRAPYRAVSSEVGAEASARSGRGMLMKFVLEIIQFAETRASTEENDGYFDRPMSSCSVGRACDSKCSTTDPSARCNFIKLLTFY